MSAQTMVSTSAGATGVIGVTEANQCDFSLTNLADNSTDWHYSCSESYYDIHDWILFTLVIISHAILAILSKREITSSHRRWGKFCWGHPGISYPLNMLDGYEHRLAYCAAFGSMTFELTSILWNPYGRFTSFGIGHSLSGNEIVVHYPVLRLLVLLIQVGICTFMFYPLFFALATNYKFIGAIIGIVLSTYRFGVWIWLSTCSDIEEDILSKGFKVKKNLLAILIWPCLICISLLIWQYILILITCIRQRSFGASTTPEPVALPHHIEHVKYLLGKKPLPWSEKDLHHVSIFNKDKFLANFGFYHLPGFKFPTRVLATFVVTVLALYQMGTQVAFTVYSGLKVIRRFVRCANVFLPAVIVTKIEPYTEYIMRYVNILANLWIITMVFNCIMAIVYVYHMCLCYRKHTLRIYKGNRVMFPKNWIRENNHNILTAASRQAGLQIAYTIWGFVIIQAFVFLIMTGIIFLLFVPAIDFKYYNIIYYILQVVVASLVLNQLIYWAQMLFNRFLFLQGKINPTDEKPPLAIDNRKSWYNVSFFFFFWNLFLGIISALMRIIKGLALGVFFIPRIDRPVLMKGFETMDNGYYAYLCLLTVINTHDHPVVKSFVQCLMDGVKHKRRGSTEFKGFAEERYPIRNGVTYAYYDKEPDTVGDVSYHQKSSAVGHTSNNTIAGSKRAKYYWFLAYTLINNPDLLNYRKVDVDEVDDPAMRAEGIARKHKIVLAIHRKNKGEKTSNLYERDSMNV